MVTAARSLAFIDSRVADYQTLIDGLAEGTAWFLLDAGDDGIGQMAKILSSYSSLDAIHVFSHGSPGALYMGSMVLDSGNLSAYEASFQAIGASLSETGDILLYGCNVAQGSLGQDFIEQLAAATGANVAASTDPTGAAALGGDWVLEEVVGTVEADPVLVDGAAGSFKATLSRLPTYTINDIADYVQHGFFDWVGQEYITLPDDYHSFNMGESGIGANNDVLFYNYSGGKYLGLNTDLNGLTAEWRVVVDAVFDYLGTILGIDFVETTSTDDNVDIYFVDYDGPDWGSEAQTTYELLASGDVTQGDRHRYTDFAIVNIEDGFAVNPYHTVLHETLHALGLGHSGPYNNSVPIYITDALQANDSSKFYNTYLNDSYQQSIMSYINQQQNTTVNASPVWVVTPMAADFQVLRSYYPFSAFLGPTTYGENTNIIDASAGPVMMNLKDYADKAAFCIIDDGGVDTVDFHNYRQDQRIDLTVPTGNSEVQFASDIGGLKGNMTLAVGTVIENAVSGSGNDTIHGNEVENVLRGGIGNDYLYGEGGNDTLFGNGVDYAPKSSIDDDTLYGGGGNDTLYGEGGNDVIHGEDDNDTIYAGDHLDTLYGDEGDDYLKGEGGIDTLYGGLNNDEIYGDEEGDNLLGEGGNDTLYGGSGDDTLEGGADADTLKGESGSDHFIFTATAVDDARTGIFDTISDYDQGNATNHIYFAGEGDIIDLTAAIASLYPTPQASLKDLVRAEKDAIGAFANLFIKNPDTSDPGKLWLKIAQLDGIKGGDTLQLKLGPTNTAATTDIIVSGGAIVPSTSVSSGFRNPLGDGSNWTESDDGDGYYVYPGQNFNDLVTFSNGNKSYHLGEDWNAEGREDRGDPVYAISNGEVVAVVGNQGSSTTGFGNYVVLRHDLPHAELINGKMVNSVYSLYAHLDTTSVSIGQMISIGYELGTIGDSGYSEGPHLHFEITLAPTLPTSADGYNPLGAPSTWIDPTDFINQHRNLSSTHSVSISDASLVEGDSGSQQMVFTVTRSGGTSTFDVNYATTDGTAFVTDGDYLATSGTLHFNAGENVKTVSVTIKGDSSDAIDETFHVLLTSPTSGVAVGDGVGIGTLVNDDFLAGTGGAVTTAIGTSEDYGSGGVTIQADGKILVAGYSLVGVSHDFALVRYNADGSLDTSFDTDGVVTTDFGGDDWIAGGVKLQADGRILVAGNNTNRTVALARYNTNGSLDTSFSSDGKLTADITSGLDLVMGLAVQSDGKILVSGWTIGDDFSLARFNTDGTLDNSFSGDGRFTIDFGGWDTGYSVVVQPDGKIVMSGQHYAGGNDFALARIDAAGNMDSSFGAAGKVTTNFLGNDFGSSLILQEDGKILVAGTVNSGSNSDFGIARYNANGSLDSSFGVGGKITTNFGGEESVAFHNIALQTDGKILVAGNSIIGSNSDFALARYNVDGSLDASFSSDGMVTTAIGAGNDSASGIVVQGDGKIVVVGESFNGSNYDLAVARFNTDGSLDTTFNGLVQAKTDDYADEASDITAPVGAIEIGSPITAIIGPADTNDTYGDKDVFKVLLTQGQTYSIHLKSTLVDGQALPQGIFTIRDGANFNTILETSAIGADVTETFTAGSTGYYFIRVGTGGAATDKGGYQLSVDNLSAWSISSTQNRVEEDTDSVTFTVTRPSSNGAWTVYVSTTPSEGFANDGDYAGKVDEPLFFADGQQSKTVTVTLSPDAVVEPDETFGLIVQEFPGQDPTNYLSKQTFTILNDDTSLNHAPTGFVTISGSATQGQALSASNTLADVDGLGTIAYQWLADGSIIAGATGSTFALGEAQVGKAITVTASYTDGRGTVESLTSNATAAVANLNDAPTGSVTIAGTPTQGQTLTAAITLDDADGLGAIAYQWLADGSVIAGATASTFVLGEAQVGKEITVTASYTDGRGTVEALISNATAAVANLNDLPTGSVTITGTPTQGQTLTAANTLADADGLGTIAYQWNADGTAIAGATGSTFALGEAQVGEAITVTASYTDGHGTAEAKNSSATSLVANLNELPTGSVTITGTPTQGQTLTASNTLGDADGLGAIAYEWRADDSVIAGATASTLVLAEAHVGKAITVTASYTDGHGTGESVPSAATSIVANLNDLPTGSVTITGTPTQGQTLTASNTLADADGLGTIAYQWLADGSIIAGATASTLVLGEAQVGKAIIVTASYTDGHGTAGAVTSNATATVANLNDAPTGSVTITGTPTQGQTLTAANTLADADGLGTIAYQWNADGTAIVGATGSTLVLAEAQVGKTISVKASYTDGHGTAEAVTSNATAAVANVNDAPTGAVTIAGTPTQGQTLSAANTLADADGLGPIAYQWLVDGNVIAGATASTFVLAEAQVGKAITVTASYTDGHGTAEAVTSGPTGLVANLNDEPTGAVTISGTPTQGQTLTASNTLADADGLGTIAYQWLADGSTIAGATTSTFVLGEAQVGKAISVKASYTDGHGTAEALTSNATTAVANVNDAPTGAVAIAGTLTQGQTLTAANTLADADGLGTIAYQWNADGTAIAGATGSLFVLTQSQVGKAITVAASYTDGHGTLESVASGATGVVTGLTNTPPTGSVTISGTATQGQTLRASNTLADADGLGTIAYRWLANGSIIAGATASTFVLGEAQVGKAIAVTASYTDGHGTAESVASAATGTVLGYRLGTSGSDTLVGTSYADVIYGLAGKDNLTGKGGSDRLDGGAGADTMLGGAGDDTYVVDNASDTVLETTTAKSNLDAGGTDTVESSVTWTLGDFLENLMLTGSANIDGTGNTLANALSGNDGANTLYGLAGNDTLNGGAGNDDLFGGAGNDALNGDAGKDQLTGGAGNDTLNGGAGSDLLIGGNGNDLLTGGLGADIFRFNDTALNASTNVDMILDFRAGSDAIQLDSAVFRKLSANGALSAAHFRASADGTAGDANDYILYDTDSGALYYDADGSGKGAAIQFATVVIVGTTPLSAADFIVT